MTLKMSTGLANAILAGSSIKEELDNGFIYIFSGTVPDDADAANANTLLVKIAADAVPVDAGVEGLDFAASASSRAIAKSGAQDWAGVVVATGTATFYRFCESGDAGTSASTTASRIQGTVGLSGADINLTSVALVDNDTNTVGLSTYEIRFDT